MSHRRALMILAFITLATSLPFLNRPYFVDDYYFVKMAKGILEHPARPYDFRSDDDGKNNIAWETGQKPRMVNPPLFHYYLAAVIKFFGEREWVLRGSMIPFALAGLACMYFLGCRFSPDPFGSAMLFAVTPVFWLTSYSLLIDSMLIAFVLGGILVFIKACEDHSALLAAGAGVLLGLTILVKYFGVIALVLAILWQLSSADRRRWGPGYQAIFIAVMIQLVWAMWNVATYGQSHLLASLGRGMNGVGWGYFDKLIVLGSFAGGGLFFTVGAWALLGRGTLLRLLLAIGLTAVLAITLASRIGGFDWWTAAQIAFWTGSSFAFLLLIGARRDLWRDEKGKFLLIWLGIGIVELIVVMPWTAGRYLLCVAPAACWIASRLASSGPRWLWSGMIASTAVAGCLTAGADYAQANTIRQLSQTLPRSVPIGMKYYLGDTFSGFEPYLGPLGWTAAFPNREFKKGDLILLPVYRRSAWWTLPRHLSLEFVETHIFESPLLIRVLDVRASAGWYASVWGALPYAISRHLLERYEIYRVKE